jgi:hypothetical protein
MNLEIFTIECIGEDRYRVGLRLAGSVVAYSVTVGDKPVPNLAAPDSLWNLLQGSKMATTTLTSAVLDVHRRGSTQLPITLLPDVGEFKLRSEKDEINTVRSDRWFLSEESVGWALEHLIRRCNNSLFPVPFEHLVIKDRSPEFAGQAQRINLSEHVMIGHRQLSVPKSSAGFRLGTQLDPLDAIILTAVGYELGEHLENARIPTSEGIVFSFRFSPTHNGDIWDPLIRYSQFLERTHELAVTRNTEVIVETDISAFYHRLTPRLISATLERLGVRRKQAAAVSRLLDSLEIEGLPVGPSVSAIFAEAVLTPIDLHLLASGISFARFNDDYRFFCKSDVEARQVLQLLHDSLARTAGLTIQDSKTKIIEKVKYVTRLEHDWIATLFEEANLVYGEEEIEDEVLHSKLTDATLSLLEKALDYDTVARPWICKKAFTSLSLEKRREMLPIVLEELPRVSAVAQEVARSLQKLLLLSDGGGELLQMVLRQLEKESSALPDAAATWLLHAFRHEEWSGKETLASLDDKLDPDWRAARRELIASLRHTAASGSVKYDARDHWQRRAHVWATGRIDSVPLENHSRIREEWERMLYEAVATAEDISGADVPS